MKCDRCKHKGFTALCAKCDDFYDNITEYSSHFEAGIPEISPSKGPDIVIQVLGGVVVDVERKHGWMSVLTIEVHDYDIDGALPEELEKDKSGKHYRRSKC